jgi:hypothetical protein
MWALLVSDGPMWIWCTGYPYAETGLAYRGGEWGREEFQGSPLGQV